MPSGGEGLAAGRGEGEGEGESAASALLGDASVLLPEVCADGLSGDSAA